MDAFPGLIHVVSNVSPSSVEEVLQGNDLTGNARRRMLQPAQKSDALMKDLVGGS